MNVLFLPVKVLVEGVFDMLSSALLYLEYENTFT